MIKRSAAIVGVVLALGATAAVAIAIWPERAGEGGSTSTGQPPVGSAAGRAGGLDGGTQAGIPSVTAPDIGTAPLTVDARFALRPLAGPSPVRYRFKHPPLAGVLFDIRTGKVLWQRHPRLEHPIASLTKMMTALLIVEREDPHDRVRITRRATRTPARTRIREAGLTGSRRDII